MKKLIKRIFVGAGVFSFLCLVGVFFFTMTSVSHNSISRNVASSFEEQYNLARKAGNVMDICVQAGLVKAAYLQAKDEKNYAKWTQNEAHDCAAAGLKR